MDGSRFDCRSFVWAGPHPTEKGGAPTGFFGPCSYKGLPVADLDLFGVEPSPAPASHPKEVHHPLSPPRSPLLPRPSGGDSNFLPANPICKGFSQNLGIST